MKKMKKVLAVALSLVMAGSLAACGSSSTETKAPETGASETAAESTAAATGEYTFNDQPSVIRLSSAADIS